MLTFKHLSNVSGIEHGVTEKGDEIPPSIVFGEQVHKNKAVWVEDSSKKVIRGADALVTKHVGLTLGVNAADCVPVLIADHHANIVGSIHAGWRGTALDITRKTIEFLKINPSQLLVGLGPAICPNCFEVGEEVARQFGLNVVRESEKDNGKFFVDLWQANIDQCLELGIPQRNIEVIRKCTFEDDTLFSYRRGDRDGHHVAWIRRI